MTEDEAVQAARQHDEGTIFMKDQARLTGWTLKQTVRAVSGRPGAIEAIERVSKRGYE